MEDNYPKAYKELHEILQHVPKQDIEKIPKDVLKTIEAKMDKKYEFKLQENIELKDQNMLRETKALLAVIYRDYWATDLEKNRIIAKEKYDIQKSKKIN